MTPLFEAAQKVSRDNSKWSPRNLPEDVEAWLLRRLVRCGPCDTGAGCQKIVSPEGKVHRYYWCPNHADARVARQQRCPERNIRADALDDFVFGQVRAALLRPDVLLAGQTALTAATPVPDDELLAVELSRLDRKLDSQPSRTPPPRRPVPVRAPRAHRSPTTRPGHRRPPLRSSPNSTKD